MGRISVLPTRAPGPGQGKKGARMRAARVTRVMAFYDNDLPLIIKIRLASKRSDYHPAYDPVRQITKGRKARGLNDSHRHVTF